jgi:four helix bundle protein
MNPKTVALQRRTRKFLARVIRFCESLPEHGAAERIKPQLLDSAGSADSNYRAACRARSRKELIAKIGIAIEEADEAKGWLEALLDVDLGDENQGTALAREADELTAIFVASRKTAEKNATAPRQVSQHNRKS